MRLTSIFLAAAALLLFGALPANSQSASEEELAADLIHSDLPLFRGGAEDMWPRPFADQESFGCTSRVAFGDWLFRETNRDDDAEWYRVGNYGVFHCFANVVHAYAREDLSRTDPRPSFFVLLGTTGDTELWAMQIGARPGSDYLLLSRPRGEGLVSSFTVLQRQCPRGHMRNGAPLDILITRYCAINTRADFLRLARRMADRRPLGTLSLVEDGPNETDDAAAPNAN